VEIADIPFGPVRLRIIGTTSSGLIFPCAASFALATSEGSNLPSAILTDSGLIAHIPCSRNFLTFHNVINAVGEEEIMMIG
jgi:hypothetical protein